MWRALKLLGAARLRETDRVPEFCSCGAALPPDARFCHKCGKPQFEEPPSEPEAPPPVIAVPVAPPPPTEISFHNLAAVRVGITVAGLAFLAGTLGSLLGPLPIQFMIYFVVFLSSGFLSVYLYTRRTGQSLSVRGGARMGWITGVFSFMISTVLFTLGMIAVTGRGGLAALYREQSQAMGLPDQVAERAVEILQNPAGLAMFLLIVLVTQFVIYTVISSVGGALGAKVLEKD